MPNVQASVAFSAMLVDLVPDVRLRGVDVGQPISRVGIACGSGGSLLEAAAQCGCDAFITGEATYHTCLEAQARKISLFMLGHFASERFSIELLIERLRATFPELSAWPSKSEQDPVRNLG
jgi:putative NIF3 family GTP cyclohydrolase 1 type 2